MARELEPARESSRAIAAASLKARPAWARARREGLLGVVHGEPDEEHAAPGPRPRAPDLS